MASCRAGNCSISCSNGCACIADADNPSDCRCICSGDGSSALKPRLKRPSRQDLVIDDMGWVVLRARGIRTVDLAVLLQSVYPGKLAVPVEKAHKRVSVHISRRRRLGSVMRSLGVVVTKKGFRPKRLLRKRG